MPEVLTTFLVAFIGGALGALAVYKLRRMLDLPVTLPPGPRNPRHPSTKGEDFLTPLTQERSRYGTCRGCGAPEDTWCDPACVLLDRWDYR